MIIRTIWDEGTCEPIPSSVLEISEKVAKLALQAVCEDHGSSLPESDIEVEISASLVSEEEIRGLNREYRNIDKVTDVLSFPQYESIEDLVAESQRFSNKEEGLVFSLGDVVICRGKIEEQGRELGHGFEREMIYLFLHSILHILGHDHECSEDKRAMRSKEKKIISEIGL